MNEAPKKVRALGLCSGGLDSILSALVLRSQDIEVQWICFETPFFTAEKARDASLATGVPLTVEDITPVYLEMLRDPPCGYGQHMNPCLDCHALMFRMAALRMRRDDFHFLFSGEVLGQRPMSQTKPSLRYVEKHSGADGYIVRPLSARRLTETIPEQRGWVDRERLLDFAGRSRKPQIALAQRYGVREYPAPAGGCLLTDKGYALRLKDLFDHVETPAVRDYHLLKIGRHLRLDPGTKIVVGRTHIENEQILELWNPETDALIRVARYPGPVILIPGGAARPESETLAGAIGVGYSKAPRDLSAQIRIETPGDQRSGTVIGIPPEEIQSLLIR